MHLFLASSTLSFFPKFVLLQKLRKVLNWIPKHFPFHWVEFLGSMWILTVEDYQRYFIVFYFLWFFSIFLNFFKFKFLKICFFYFSCYVFNKMISKQLKIFKCSPVLVFSLFFVFLCYFLYFKSPTTTNSFKSIYIFALYLYQFWYPQN